MHVKFNISPRFSIPFISINTKTESADLLQLGRNIERLISKRLIVGQSGAKTVPIPLYQIIRFQTAEKHVVCETIEATYRSNIGFTNWPSSWKRTTLFKYRVQKLLI
ncbi:hypothetical protein [Secundilactobacillus kimchicus]|uniref:hypothetical protein n=1 Tax=Secundilactobacillus kimchicus TaxID=528209 RepID=UPI0006D06DFC|nr:hypothetical protein [Secundilactobacillus kimchicus]